MCFVASLAARDDHRGPGEKESQQIPNCDALNKLILRRARDVRRRDLAEVGAWLALAEKPWRDDHRDNRRGQEPSTSGLRDTEKRLGVSG